MINVLNSIPVDFELEALMKSVHIDPDSEDAVEFEKLVVRAEEVARPKAVFKECYIGRRGDYSVEIDGVTFKSIVLSKNLEKAERVFAYVVTCGHEFDRLSVDFTDFMSSFWLDAIKTRALKAGMLYLNNHLESNFAIGKAANMNPGSGDVSVWSIEQQKELFYLLGDVKAVIGVELTPSFLMIPNKTVSGIIFPTGTDYRACQLCHRKDCPSRLADFDSMLWQSMRHE